MSVMSIVPVDETGEPFPGLRDPGENLRIAHTVFYRLEKTFDERVIITYPWPGKRQAHLQLCQKRYQ